MTRWAATIRARAAFREIARHVFAEAGYLEVETPTLREEVCVDACIDPVVAAGSFLQPSPELAMKQLLADESVAADHPAIWQLGKAFRAGEQGRQHRIEFTMCEWYRLGDDHQAQMAFTEHFVDALHRSRVSRRPAPPRPYARIGYYDAMAHVLGRRIEHAGDEELAELVLAKAAGSLEPLGREATRDDWLNAALALFVEPWLAQFAACFLVDYPASQAALARTRFDAARDLPVAERFELYLADGRGHVVEVANGYHELTDAAEARRRFEQANARRGDPLPLPEHFLAVQDRLPPCSGVALGWDRLLMHLLGTDDIATVLTPP